ncbi:MAG: hypothetical protein K5855_03465 [Oscillospiraceae bacterium]|nr:hypothetical protein [Oscillospiraceae bacterium]
MDRYLRIRQLADSGGLSHAWIVFGEDDAERDRLTAFLASALLCRAKSGRPCGSCPDCRKSAGGIHPDLIKVVRQPDRRELVVEQIRDMTAEAYIRPNEAGRKVFVIEQAELLNVSAQNAMLKIIEEPPAYAAFILSARNPGGFLETVRSRCVELSAASGGEERVFSPLAEELAGAVLAGDLRALAGASVKAEKLDRADFDALTDELYVLFAVKAREPELREAAAEAAGWMDALRAMRRSNVSAGHCMGYLLSLVK